MKRSRIFKAALIELDKMMYWLREVLKESGMGDKQAKKMEVAVEEALVNIISYAYGYPPGLVEIDCFTEKETRILHVILKDQGSPFNPLDKKAPDIAQPLEERTDGGLGIHLMKQLTDHISYKRENRENVLTLTKAL